MHVGTRAVQTSVRQVGACLLDNLSSIVLEDGIDSKGDDLPLDDLPVDLASVLMHASCMHIVRSCI